MPRPPHVPPTYRPHTGRKVTAWSDRAQPEMVDWLDDAAERVEQRLAHPLERPLHAVIYASTSDAYRALGRRISVTALLAPVHAPEGALVAVHSPHLHPRNRDPTRMLRHLCHELSHVHTAEGTGSVKRLGDGNVGMRLATWIDEGLAECTAAVSANQPAIVERALVRARDATLSGAELDRALNDLNHPMRSVAFAIATATVGRRVQEHSLAGVFRVVSALAHPWCPSSVWQDEPDGGAASR